MYTSLDNVYLEKVKKIGVRAPWINVISEADVEQVQPESLPVKDITPKKSSGPAISYDGICNKVINSDPQLKKLADEWVAKKIPLLPTTTETNSITYLLIFGINCISANTSECLSLMAPICLE